MKAYLVAYQVGGGWEVQTRPPNSIAYWGKTKVIAVRSALKHLGGPKLKVRVLRWRREDFKIVRIYFGKDRIPHGWGIQTYLGLNDCTDCRSYEEVEKSIIKTIKGEMGYIIGVPPESYPDGEKGSQAAIAFRVGEVE